MASDTCPICLESCSSVQDCCTRFVHDACLTRWALRCARKQHPDVACPACQQPISATLSTRRGSQSLGTFAVQWRRVAPRSAAGGDTRTGRFAAVLPREQPDDCWYYIGPYPWRGHCDHGHGVRRTSSGRKAVLLSLSSTEEREYRRAGVAFAVYCVRAGRCGPGALQAIGDAVLTMNAPPAHDAPTDHTVIPGTRHVIAL